MPWFQRRRAVAEQEQHRIWRQARSKANVETFLTSMTEVEVLDSFSAVERHLIIELQVSYITSTNITYLKIPNSTSCFMCQAVSYVISNEDFNFSI